MQHLSFGFTMPRFGTTVQHSITAWSHHVMFVEFACRLPYRSVSFYDILADTVIDLIARRAPSDPMCWKSSHLEVMGGWLCRTWDVQFQFSVKGSVSSTLQLSEMIRLLRVLRRKKLKEMTGKSTEVFQVGYEI